MKVWKIINLILLFILILIALQLFTGNIAFGHGLGDLFYFGIIYFVLLIHLCFTFFVRNKDVTYYKVLSIIFLLFIIGIIFKATILRGPEYPWNGNILYG